MINKIEKMSAINHKINREFERSASTSQKQRSRAEMSDFLLGDHKNTRSAAFGIAEFDTVFLRNELTLETPGDTLSWLQIVSLNTRKENILSHRS